MGEDADELKMIAAELGYKAPNCSKKSKGGGNKSSFRSPRPQSDFCCFLS